LFVFFGGVGCGVGVGGGLGGGGGGGGEERVLKAIVTLLSV